MATSATAILDRFLHHATVIAIAGRSYRLREGGATAASGETESKPANAPTGSGNRKSKNNPTEDRVETCQP